MASSLLEAAQFMSACVEKLRGQKRQSASARKRVCEASRFLRCRLISAQVTGHCILPSKLADWIDRLFRAAIQEMAREEDCYYSNVRHRYEGELGVKVVIERAKRSGVTGGGTARQHAAARQRRVNPASRGPR